MTKAHLFVLRVCGAVVFAGCTQSVEPTVFSITPAGGVVTFASGAVALRIVRGDRGGRPCRNPVPFNGACSVVRAVWCVQCGACSVVRAISDGGQVPGPDGVGESLK